MAIEEILDLEQLEVNMFRGGVFSPESGFLQRTFGGHVAGQSLVSAVRTVEAWGYAPAAFAVPGMVDVVRSYPDRGHGTLAVMGPPANTRLVSFPLIAGRWLERDDVDAVVLNHMATAQRPFATFFFGSLTSSERVVPSSIPAWERTP